MKKKIILGIICLLAFIGSGKAVTHEELWGKLQNIAPNQVFEIKAIKPSNDDEFRHFSGLYLNQLSTAEYYLELVGWNEDYSNSDLGIQMRYEEMGLGTNVNIKWQEADSNVKAEVEKVKAEFLKLEEKDFIVEDLSVIDYFRHTNAELSDYSMAYKNMIIQFKNTINNAKIDLMSFPDAGGEMPLSGGAQYLMEFLYDGVIYDCTDGANNEYVSLGYQNVLYVPDDTANTSDAYIAAAKARIDNYFGTNDIKIVAHPLEEIYTDWDATEEGLSYMVSDLSKAGDYYYVLTINNEELPFLIVRDSSKIEVPKVTVADVATKVSISSTSSEVPKDIVLQASIIGSETTEYKNILNTLKVKVAQVFDLKLYSQSENKYVTKLTNGEFAITIPISEELKGKELAAYYIGDDGKIEIHPITIKDGMGTFTTNHFSVYTIAELKTIEEIMSPDTADNVMGYIILTSIGLVGLAVTITKLKKRMN